MRRISHLFGGSFLLAAAVACGGGSNGVDLGGGGGNCRADQFCMTSNTFTPTSRTVSVNTAVRWENDSGVAHNVTFDTPEAALGAGNFPGDGGNFQAPDKTANIRQFATAGSYPFHCTIHGTATSGMRGTVVVQ